MPLESGQKLVHYRLVEQIGEGGMGVVWKAEDTKLGRSVAIKVLPDLFASDPERLARFEREAKLLAALNHPNIAAIHGLEDAEGVRFLVLELVGGETLADRLQSGPLSTDEALEIGRQIAEALAAAHEQGILHRDLKPANIKITEEGKVKVLDFGLAKAIEPAGGDTSLTASPTLTSGGTAAGVIMGTASYMSPEQARGKPLDKRTDVWAFGCVLFECLTARKIFAGETVTDILGAILHREPEWNLLPSSLPASVARLLRRCLQREPRQRLHDIADARILLEEAKAERSFVGQAVSGEPARRGPAAWILALGGLVLAAGGFFAGRALVSEAPALRSAGEVRFTVVHTPFPSEPPQGQEPMTAQFLDFFPPLAFSADGKRMVYSVLDPDGIVRLYLREIGQNEATPIRGSEGAVGPFLSPDGEWVGFAAQRDIHVLRVSGGTPRRLASVGNFKGAVWTRDEEVFFSPNADAGVYRIPADGGEAELVSLPDPERNERTHRWPQELPDGRGILLTVGTSTIRTFDEANLAVLVPETGETKIVLEGGMFGRYLPSGHLLYARDSTLFFVPFDLDKLEVTGRPEAVMEGVVTAPLTGAAFFAVSASGDLAFIRGEQAKEREIWSLGFDGAAGKVVDKVDYFDDVQVSPDGKLLVLQVDGANSDLWIHNLERQSSSRLTFAWNNISPVWTPDGTRIAYTIGRAGTGNIFWQAVDGSGEPEELLAGEALKLPESFSPDGKSLAYLQITPESSADIWIFDMEERAGKPFLATQFAESNPRFSPDGKWICYLSNESGRRQLFVRPFPGPGAKYQVSIDGADAGDWAPDNRSLIFGKDQDFYRVRIDTSVGFGVSRPEKILTTDLDLVSVKLRPDGAGVFAVVELETELVPTEIQVMMNWATGALDSGD